MRPTSLRIWPTDQLSIRADGDAGADGNLVFEGYSSVTEWTYPVYGGAWPGWQETIASGAFTKTLDEGADVSFLVNHTGMTLARTKSGTLELSEDDTGEHVRALLSPNNSQVRDLADAVNRGDIDEMSFAFRVMRDEWTDDDGNESDMWNGTQRRILEINQHKGDVSAVNYGASDATSIIMLDDGDVSLVHKRAGQTVPDGMMAELRSGRSLAPDQVLALRGEPQMYDENLAALMRAHWDRRLRV